MTETLKLTLKLTDSRRLNLGVEYLVANQIAVPVVQWDASKCDYQRA